MQFYWNNKYVIWEYLRKCLKSAKILQNTYALEISSNENEDYYTKEVDSKDAKTTLSEYRIKNKDMVISILILWGKSYPRLPR